MNSFASQGNVLIILPPIVASAMHAEFCEKAAGRLKRNGAHRADLTADPRSIATMEKQARGYPVPAFSGAARELSQTILRPAIGRSDVCDLSYAITGERVRLPDLETLTTVGSIFLSAAADNTKKFQSFEGRGIGLVLYLAFHGQAMDSNRYDSLVFPQLNEPSCRALELLDRHLFSMDADLRIPTIDLNAARRKMMALHGNVANRVLN